MATVQGTSTTAPISTVHTPTDAQPEEWRVCLSGFYEASTHGRIRRLIPRTNSPKGRVIKFKTDRNGYKRMLAHCDGAKKHVLAHRIICETFHGAAPAPGMHVNHKNGIKDDNRPENLEWMTAEENEAHAVANGLKARGERNWNTKLTPEAIRDIRNRRKKGPNRAPVKALMEEYGVCKTTIIETACRRKWDYIPDEPASPVVPSEME